MSGNENSLEIGIVGLGTIGGNLAEQAIEKGIRVVGLNPSERPELTEKGVPVYGLDEFESFAEELEPPRKVYLSVPAGEMVDEDIEQLVPHLDGGDVVMDGGNSFWRDSIRREEVLWDEHGVYYLDTGTSGGLPGARNGACFMVGGREEGFERVEPILDELSVEGGLVHTGPPGSGHFVKLVHNGVEFGMLQSIAEGVELLEAGQWDLDLEAVFHNWANGSVIRSWLVELMEQELRDPSNEGGFDEIPSHIEDTGEVNWLVQEAFKGETPIPVISQSVTELFKSRGQQRYAPKAVAAMRKGFGSHPYGEEEFIENERVTGRVTNESRRRLAGEDSDREPVSSVRFDSQYEGEKSEEKSPQE